MPIPAFVITVGSLLANALVQASLKKTSEAITDPIFTKAKDKFEQRFKKGKYGAIHKALLAARDDILQQCTTTEQHRYVKQILDPLFSANSRLLSAEFNEQAGRYLLPSPETPPAQSLAITYRRVSGVAAILKKEAPDEIALTRLLEAFLTAFRERLLQHKDFAHLRDYYQLKETRHQTNLQTEICDLLEAIVANTARPVKPIEDFSEIHQAYLDYQIRTIEAHPIIGFAPQIGGGRVISLPLSEIFLPLHSIEGQPALAKYADEDLKRQAASEVKFKLRHELDYQRFRYEMERRYRQLRAEQAAQQPFNLTDLLKSPRSVLLGDPGTGKTTTTQYITYALAANDTTHIPPKAAGLTPILIRIANYAQIYEQDKSLHLIEYIERELTSREDFGRYLRWAVEQGECLIILDGLDEVGDPGLRMQITERIQNMVATFSQNHFLVTSRIVGYDQSPLTQDFRHSILQELTQEDKERFIRLWYQAIQAKTGLEGQSEGADDLIAALQNKPQISRMAANPLLLTIMVLMHWRGTKLPSRRVQVYQSATDTLIEYWTAHREGLDLDAEEVKNILAPIAHHIVSSNVSGVIPHRELLPRFYQGIINERGCSKEEAKRIGRVMLKNLNEHSGLFLERGFDADGQPVYGFLHQTFGEYLAGLHMMRNMQAGELELKEYIHRSVWYEPLLLMIGQLTLNSRPQASKLMRQILEYPAPYEDILQRNLLLAADCLADDIQVIPELRDEVLKKLAKLCENPVPTLRDEAVKRYERLAVTRHQENALTILKSSYPFEDTTQLNNLEEDILGILAKALICLNDKPAARQIIEHLQDNNPSDGSLRRLRFEHWPNEATDYLLALQADDEYSFSVRAEINRSDLALEQLDMNLTQQVLGEVGLIALLGQLADHSEDEDEKARLRWLAVLADSKATDEMVFAFTAEDMPIDIREIAAKKSLENDEHRPAAIAALQNLVDDYPILCTSVAQTFFDTDNHEHLDMPLLRDTALIDEYGNAAVAIRILFGMEEVAIALPAAIRFLAEGRYDWELVEELIEHTVGGVGIAAARWMALSPGYAYRWEACQALLEKGCTDETIPLLQYLAYECHNYDSQQAVERLLTLDENERAIPLLLEMRQSVTPEVRYQASLMLVLSEYAVDPDQEKAPKRIDLKVGILEERTQAYKAAVRTFCEVSLNALDSLDVADDERARAYIILARFNLARLAQASNVAVSAVSVTLDELLESPSPAVRLFACKYAIESGRLEWAERVARELLTRSLSDLSFQIQSAALKIQWATQTQVAGNQLTILQKVLHNPQVLVRHWAAYALGVSGDETTLNDMITALDDEDSKVREWAAYGLGMMANPAALVPLAERVADKKEKEQVRVDAVEALWKLGDFAAVPHLVDALGDESHKIRAAAAYGLGWLEDRSVVQSLIKALNDENRDVRQSAVWALTRLQDTEAIQPLIKALADENNGVRWRAAYALGQVGGSEAVPALITALEDKNKQVRQYAVQALGKLGDSLAIQPLRMAMRNVKWADSEVVTQNIIIALRKLGSSIDTMALTEALESDNWETQAVAALTLFYADETTAYELCLPLLKHKKSRVRYSALYAVARLGKELAVQHLQAALTDEASLVRQAAVWGLNGIPDLTTVEDIIVGLGDGVGYVRQNNVGALENFGPSNTQSTLIAMLNDNDPAVRRQTASALRLGNSKAVSSLIQTFLRDPDVKVCQAAAWALGKLGDNKTCAPYLVRHLEGETAKALARMGFTGIVPHIVVVATGVADNDEATSYAFSLIHLDAEVALNVLDQYERLYRTSSWVPRLRGFALAKLGKTEAALENFHAALKIEPDSILHQRNLAMFHIEQGNLTKAADYISNAVILPFPGAYPLLAHAVILWQQGEQDLALEQLAKAQRQDRYVTDIEDLRFNEFWGPKALATVEEMLAQ